MRKFGYLVVTVNEQGVHVQNVYSDRQKAAELVEIFFVDLILTDKIRWISGIVFVVGLVFLLMGQRWGKLLRKFKRT